MLSALSVSRTRRNGWAFPPNPTQPQHIASWIAWFVIISFVLVFSVFFSSFPSVFVGESERAEILGIFFLISLIIPFHPFALAPTKSPPWSLDPPLFLKPNTNPKRTHKKTTTGSTSCCRGAIFPQPQFVRPGRRPQVIPCKSDFFSRFF